jgi:hypothetical protein
MELILEYFGPPALREPGSDEPLPLTPMGLALLAYLGVEQPVYRADLAALLWPDADSAHARQSLRQLMSSLRAAVGEDLFEGRDPVRLSGRIRSEWRDFERGIEENDDERLEPIMRGPFLSGLYIERAPALSDWQDLMTERVRVRYGAHLAELHERALLTGSQADLEAIGGRARLLGLESKLLHISGSPVEHWDWAGGRVGAEALKSVVYRARKGMPHMAVPCLASDAASVAQIVDEVAAGLPEATRPRVVWCTNTEVERAPLGAAVALFRALLDLPGAAGAYPASHDLLSRLESGADSVAERGRLAGRLRDALWDVLDAVLEEAPLILVLRPEFWSPSSTQLLAGAVSACDLDAGLSVFICGETTEEFARPQVASLLSVFEERSPVVLHDIEPGVPALRVAGTDGALPRSSFSWRRRSRIAVLGLALAATAVAVAAAASVIRFDPAEALGDTEVLICSNRAGGVFQLYRLQPVSRVVERVSPLELAPASCRQSRPAWNTSGFVVVLLSDRRTLVKIDLTGDPRAEGPELARMTLPERFDAEGAEVSWEAAVPLSDGRVLVAPATGQTRGLPAVVVDPVTWAAEPLQFQLPGTFAWFQDERDGRAAIQMRLDQSTHALFDLDLETGTAVRVPPDSVSTSEGVYVDSGRMMYQVGPLFDDEDGSLEIWLADLEADTRTRLTENDYNEVSPRVSADGQWACWRSEEYGHWSSDIVVMDLTTLESRPIERSVERFETCRWSPVPGVLLFHRFEDAPSIGSQIGIMIAHAERGRPRELVPPTGSNLLYGFYRLP